MLDKQDFLETAKKTENLKSTASDTELYVIFST